MSLPLDTHDMRSVLSEDGQIFTLRYAAPPHLILIGAVHISQYLAQMATSCGFGVSIIDPRGIFATDQRFAPSVRLLAGWPSDYLADISLDSTTALVTLTHDPKIDEDALVCMPCLRTYFIWPVWAVHAPMPAV